MHPETEGILDEFGFTIDDVYGRDINFLLANGMDADRFVEENICKSNLKILAYLCRERENLIDRTRYCSVNEFCEAYEINQRTALERQFGEVMTEEKLMRVIKVEPEMLYRAHSRRPYKALLETLLYV